MVPITKVKRGSRKKKFQTNALLRPSLKDRADSYRLFRQGGIFDADALRTEVGAIIDGTRTFSFLPWRIANFGQWCKAFSVRT